MVDEKKLHDCPACLQHLLAMSLYNHSPVHLAVAGNLEFRHLLYFHQAHPTIARDGEFRVVTVMGDGNACIRGRLDDGLFPGCFYFFSVDCYFNRVHVFKQQSAVNSQHPDF